MAKSKIDTSTDIVENNSLDSVEETAQPATNKPKDKIPTKPNRKALWITIGSIALVFVVAGAGLWWYTRTTSKSLSGTTGSTLGNILPKISSATPTETRIPSVLDGTLVNPDVANQRPLAVMIENHPDARPQYGLSQASVVYEAIAEGGITRFMAIFGPNTASKAGPVRSVRTYYLDWALEYDAPVAHVGGNIDALDLIPQLHVKDLDQFGIGTAAYWRDPHDGVATEHTMYTDISKLRPIAQEKYGSDQNWTKPTFKTPVAAEHRPAAQTITVNFSNSPTYTVKWNYDPTTNSYLRTMAGVLHKDALNNQTIKADNIFIQNVTRRTTVTRINENGYIMDTVGSGTAKVFQDGQMIEATWSKASHNAPTIFKDPSGKDIQRNPGVTWFEIASPDVTTVTVE